MATSISWRLALVSLAVLLLSACGARWSGNCAASGGSAGGVRYVECRATVTKSGLQDPVNLGNIDAARLRIDFSASLSQPKPGAYNASVILKSAGGIVASRSFVINVSGFGGVVSDPAAATAWLRAHHGIATDFEVQLHTDFVENAGSNAVTFEVRYDNAAATGWSHAWYSGIGGPCDGCQVY